METSEAIHKTRGAAVHASAGLVALESGHWKHAVKMLEAAREALTEAQEHAETQLRAIEQETSL
jgi:hypothetical protein